ncbi:hypothetical protein GCK32_017969, partial [Trichostrongylus colubriformis]
MINGKGSDNWDLTGLIDLVKKLRWKDVGQVQKSSNEHGPEEAVEYRRGSDTLARLHEAELKVSYLSGENDRLKQHLDYCKSQMESYALGSDNGGGQDRSGVSQGLSRETRDDQNQNSAKKSQCDEQ